MATCIHGLPRYCCANCNGIPMREKPEFRRRHEDKRGESFNVDEDAKMRRAASSQSRFGDFSKPRTAWGKDIARREANELKVKLYGRFAILD